MFLDFERAFDSIEWNFIHKCLETFNFGLDLRQWIKEFDTDISSCVLNNGYASKHFHLERGVLQGCPLSSTLLVIAIELLAQSIRRSKEIHPVKTEYVVFGTQQRIASATLSNGPFSLFLGENPINQAQHCKYLGVIRDANLNFKQHVR